MEEIYHLHERLHQIHEVVVAADVRQFMRQNGLDLRHRKRRQQPNRHQHHGPQHAHDHRRDDAGGFAQFHRAANVQPGHQQAEAGLPTAVAHGPRHKAQPFQIKPATREAQQQHAHANEPANDQFVQVHGEPELPLQQNR